MTSVNLLAWVKPALHVVSDMLYPPRCPSCRSHVAADGNFCAACFEKLRMIAPPLCVRCGVPFVVMVEEGAQCPTCLDAPPRFDAARAVMVYDAISAPLVTALKFHDQWAGLARHAEMMASAGSALLASADMLVPVPLHWRRLVTRKFNQSALLAFAISARSGVPCVVDVLERVRYTRPQMRLDRATRLKNVKKAFAVAPHAALVIRNKNVLLVDDVMTTGATVEACAAALKNAGAARVDVLVLARSVRE